MRHRLKYLFFWNFITSYDQLYEIKTRHKIEYYSFKEKIKMEGKENMEEIKDSKPSLKVRASNCFRPFFSLAISAFGVFVMQCCSAMVKKFDNISIFVYIATRFGLMFLISLAIVIYRYTKMKNGSIKHI